ncbi:DUF2007 domain-containing protein [Sedimenticola hydrogenitrophicus]|uniref:putative signal transducing protein n=1 Tax=Sedimenticola hydrogenitrophicus TaxID=2967975 RepID=UPI0021A893C2|nr:DUF2007 domain-containing protein [Sedimenticola hydrogenitrophicus]
MKRLYECRDRLQAQMLHDALAAHHIETVILGDYLSGAAGELSALQFPALWVVEEADYALARQLIDRYLSEPEAERLPWRCSRCGELMEAAFDLCWNCSTPRDP